MEKQENQREYFRHAFPTPLCGEVSIAKIEGRSIESKKAHICIQNIGGGGMFFESSLDFPCIPELTLHFSFVLQGQDIQVQGVLNRKEALPKKVFQYGVTFEIEPKKQQELIRLVNSIAIKGKRMNYEGCQLCSLRTVCYKHE